VLSDGAIQEILHQAMETQFSRARPAIRHFFDHGVPDADAAVSAVTIHSWVFARLNPTDTRDVARHLANVIVKEVVATSAAITGELIFRKLNLLPNQPLWTDGLGLFATHTTNKKHRFGVKGGNVVKSADCFSDDVIAAAERLSALDPSYKRDERLQLFCAKPLERELIKACAKAAVPCRVFGIHNFKEQCAWVLTRDSSACSLLIGRPAFDIPVEKNTLHVGARFVVWINDPKLAVCVIPKERP